MTVTSVYIPMPGGVRCTCPDAMSAEPQEEP